MFKALSILLLSLLPISAGVSDAELFSSIRNNDLAFLKSHVTRTNCDTRDPPGATLLMHATAFGNVEMVKALLDAGADVNVKNHFDATALIWGARGGMA